MELYILDWLSLFLRWFHVIAGVAWIGASFYFIWLDNSLEEPPDWKKEKGVKGDLWSIHGGGIYEVAKYKLAPPTMPTHLHWFKWEAYTTWITGFLLLCVVYYAKAEVYLIDPSVLVLTKSQAIGISLVSLVAGWILYDLACKSSLLKNDLALAIFLLAMMPIFSYGFTHVFSARGAFLHMGALIGTLMAANVLYVIIPSQKAFVGAVKKGNDPDPELGIKAKRRSTHNNYFTLPVLFIMISNHYPMTYGHPYNWLVLCAIILITAFARHYFNLKHRGVQKPIIIVTAVIATIVLAGLIAPKPRPQSESETTSVDFESVQKIFKNRCNTCHSKMPTDDMFTAPPGGILFDTPAEIKGRLAQIKTAVVDSVYMPLANKTKMTEEERGLLAAWIAAEGLGN